MLKELLNKMKIFKSFCAAIVTGSVYTPYVRDAIKAAEEKEKPALYTSEAWRTCREAIIAVGISAEKLGVVLNGFVHHMKMQNIARQETNNWRKMHGLQMKRKARRRKSVNKKA